MNKLSVVISAYNEEKNIRDCLVSIKELADEIIVVNNSSTDKTSKIAKDAGAKVFTQENDPKNIDLQKNFGFSKAKGAWILSLDADERLTPELTKEIRSRVSAKGGWASGPNGYWIPRKNYIFGKWIQSDMWWPDYQLKLFKKGKGKFEKSVHKALAIAGASEKLSNPLIHHNYISINQYLQKLASYTDIEAENLSREGYKFNWLDAIRFPVNDFVKTFFLQKGYRDGLHGLVLSMLQAFYMEIVFAKMWESRGFSEVTGADFLKDVNSELATSSSKIKYWISSRLINESKNPFYKLILRASRKITSSKIKARE